MSARPHARLKALRDHLGHVTDMEDLLKRGGCSGQTGSEAGGCACSGRLSATASGDQAAGARVALDIALQAGVAPNSAPVGPLLGGRPLRTAEDYVASLRDRDLVVYLFGEKLGEFVDHPMIAPSINAVAETYRLALEDPALGAATSGLTEMPTNRFLHVTTSALDVVQQSHMQRVLGRRTGTCFQRCVGMDAINALFSVTYDIDGRHRTQYHHRFQRFLAGMQRLNYVLGGAMTDPKGDRAKGPSGQEDADLFVRVVERRVDGVVLRGAKVHQTGCLNSHWLLLMPGGRMKATEADYAIACAVPVHAAGITYVVGRQSCDTRSMEAQADGIDEGNAKFSGQEATVVFDGVFVPNEFIFMNGEAEFAGDLVERFTAYHRRSYICKAGLGDVLIGAAATIADYNGAAQASHVKDKLVEMAFLNETIAGTALAASHQSRQTAAGNWQPDVLLANVCKHHVTRLPYEIARLSQDLAGGLMVTLPSSRDFDHEVVGPLLRKYLVGRPGVSVDNRRRILRLIENMTLGRNAVGYLTESMHGAGSPQAQRVLIQRLLDLEGKKRLAKQLAGVGQ